MVKKEKIMEAAYELFAEKGFNLSMAEIAMAVDLKAPSLYSHYKSKNDIIFQVIAKEINDYYGNLKESIHHTKNSSTSEEEKVKEIYSFICDYFRDSKRIRFWKNMYLIYQEEESLRSKELIRQHDSEVFILLKEILQESEIVLFWTIMQGILDYLLLYGNEDRQSQEILEKIWQAYWNTVRHKG